jgi:hypothetical protein
MQGQEIAKLEVDVAGVPGLSSTNPLSVTSTSIPILKATVSNTVEAFCRLAANIFHKDGLLNLHMSMF